DGRWPPVDFLDAGERHAGIAADIVALLGQRLGITFRPQRAASFKEMLQKVIAGDTPIGEPIAKKGDRPDHLYFSDPFFSVRYSIMTRKGVEGIRTLKDLGGKTLAIEAGFWIIKHLESHHPDIIIAPFKDTAAALKAVSYGKADAYIGTQVVATWIAREQQLSNLQFVADAGFKPNPQYFAIHKTPEWQPLVSIINKGLASISRQERRQISQRWIGSTTEAAGPDNGVVLTPKERLWLQAHPVWRVANEIDWPPFDFAEEGEPRGFSIDVISLAARKVGVDLQFINGMSWAELMAAFKAGELDVLPAVNNTAPRRAFIAFTHHYAENPLVLVTKSDQTTLKRTEDLHGRRLAVIAGYSITQHIESHHPQIERVVVKDVAEALKAVSLGRVDGFVGSLGPISYVMKKSFIPGITIVGEVDMVPVAEIRLHMGVAKERQTLRAILQKGLDAITDKELMAIRKRWMPFISGQEKEKQRVNLTQEERRWLADHPEIRLGIDPSWPPFEFFDENGAHSGISAGYVAAMEKMLGIAMTPQPGLSWPQVIDKAKAGEIDLLPMVMRSAERETFLTFTKPFVSFPVVIAGRKGESLIDGLDALDGKRIGVVKGYVTQGLLTEHHPELNLVPMETLALGLKALDEGHLHAFVDNLGAISYEMGRAVLPNVQIAGPTRFSFELAMGVRKEWPELVSILDKSLAALSREEHNTIKNTWLAVEVTFGTDLKT
ncbi:MAG: transporter substrate-binding domain-containing protein, partial [Magnetococcales bacterium]|nr:transporter substrate-binding domain-containing protein [Magnetococcales bacterium]